MSLCDRSDHGEVQTGPFQRTGGVGPGEPVEGPRQEVGCRPQRLLEFLPRAGPAHGQVELHLQRGEGCAQFVAGIGDECPFALDRPLHPVEHVVEGRRQVGELVVSGGHRELLRGFRGAERFCLPTHCLAWSKGGTGQQVGEHRRHDQNDWSSMRRMATATSGTWAKT